MNTPPKAIVFLITCLWCWAPLAQLKAVPLWVQFAASSENAFVPAGVQFRATFGGNSASTVSPSINYPDETQTNDIMILVMSSDAVSTLAAGVTLPSGWTLLHSTNSSSDGTGHVFWKRSTQANPPTETWTDLFTAGTNPAFGYQVVSYSGCVTTGSPINVSDSISKISNSTWTISVVTTVANCRVVGIFTADLPVGSTFTWNTDLIARAERDNNGAGFLTIGDQIQTTPGTKTAFGLVSTADAYASFIYALAPAL